MTSEGYPFVSQLILQFSDLQIPISRRQLRRLAEHSKTAGWYRNAKIVGAICKRWRGVDALL
jgi:hypothetical protein